MGASIKLNPTPDFLLRLLGTGMVSICVYYCLLYCLCEVAIKICVDFFQTVLMSKAEDFFRMKAVFVTRARLHAAISEIQGYYQSGAHLSQRY